MMESFVYEVIMSIALSLIASLVWFMGGQLLLTLKSREKISFMLELLYNCADQFDTAMVFGLVDVAEAQVDKILEYSAQIRNEIMPLTYWGKKKKLFNTILYNMYYTTSYYKRVWAGTDGKEEANAILEKFKNKYYYSIPICYKDKGMGTDQRSYLIFSVILMQELNNRYSVKTALENNYFVRKDEHSNMQETYLRLIVASNFKSSITINKYDLREKIFTKDEYHQYIAKKLKDTNE